MIFKPSLLASSILSSAAALAALAAAQPAAAQDAAADVAVEELVVTGSRIRLQDFTAPAPVSTVTGEAIERSGLTNVTDLMQSYPALVGSTDSQDLANAGNRGSVGLNLLNLRNLGEKRTLVLVDGRRHVAGDPGTSSVDTNAIPVALIDRVEVLTGGASAVYGADGVSGVVNFITKKNFEGLDVRTQYGWSDLGGGETAFISAVGGKNFLDGRANVTAALEYSNTDAIDPRDRKFSRPGSREVLVNNPMRYNDGLDASVWGTYDLSFARDVRYIDTATGGAVFSNNNSDSISGANFQGNGQPWRDGLYAGGFSMIGGSGTPTDLFQTELLPGLERWTGYVAGTFELTDNHRLFGEFKYNNARTSFTSQPTFDYGIFVPIDNPFMPESIRESALAPGGLATADSWLPDPGVLVGRDNFDLGQVRRDVERETFRSVIGLEGDFTPDIAYSLSYTYGQTKEDNRELNNRNNLRWFAAIDAVRDPASGNIVCRSSLDPSAIPYGDLYGNGIDAAAWAGAYAPNASGCVPVNIFGESVSDEARAWINGVARSSAKIEQHVLNGYVSGNTEAFFRLPAGPVGFVLGAEYRKEKSRFTPSDEELLGAQYGYDVTWLGQGAISTGAFDVYELFGELAVPVLRDLPFVQSLDVNAAYRFSDYSTISTTNTWNLGGQWRVNDDLMIRGSRARAVRAPNINELFLPQTQTFRTITDPCDYRNVEAGSQYRLANCIADLGFDPIATQFINTTSSSVEGVVGGNPDLGPEKGDTWTLGAVFTPRFAPGLSLSLDWYRIRLTDAVNLFTANTIIESCYDLEQPNDFCNLFTRDASTRFVDSFQEYSVNVSKYETEGFDFVAQYRFRPTDFGLSRDIGEFQLALAANRTTKLEFTEVEGADPSSELGYVGAPKWQANFDLTWMWNDLMVNYGFNWFDETKRYTDERRASSPNYVPEEYWYYSERATHDIQVQYNLQDRYALYGGVNNFTNQLPDRGTTGVNSTGAAAFTSGATPVGPLGRFFYVGLKASF
ncbi:TonB-dependent receptor [Phenylobacterium zucineum HLK1]|uniref:TonB-dependent receptor n=1 Tax=Phenylobacterium zucineum (strain HLK1) TaxID=450851 RepID=B4RH48_PHEZH|nr:TonB-dependent receptor [Phenylobacterium zucineum]ACG78996.1 TonB-dependent receptor [Phenylobacterium zucineum HLK1]